jgi:exoribonuclease II
MIKKDELVTMRAIAICFKPFLKPEEALIYCNIGRTQFAKNCADFGIYKNNSGYYKKEDLDKMLSGEPSRFIEAAKNLKM